MIEAYKHLYPIYVRYARGQGHEDPESFAQEVFCRALAANYEDRGWRKATWMGQIARNLMIDYHRRRVLTSRPLRPERVETVDHYPCETRHVMQAIAALPERWRLVLWLRYYQDQSGTDTARDVGLSERAMRTLQHRAVAGLRRALEKGSV